MRRDVWVGALGSILSSIGIGLMLAFASRTEMRGWGRGDWYGPALFVAIPILHGMAAGILSQCWEPRPWGVAAKAAWLSVGLMTLGFLVSAAEGIVCLLMAAPLVLPLIFLGAWLGWRARQGSGVARVSFPAVGVVALAVGGGTILPAPESGGEVRTSWWVDAPPSRVWPLVLGLDSIPEPDWWLFRLGVAHPLRTWTREDGTRMCELSTGSMPEIVIAREEGRRLTFRVLATPPSIRETNPFGEVHAPHLRTTYRCREGEFVLTPERGGTRLDTRSTYGLRMGPAWYWRLWSAMIVRHTHERVVREISRRVSAG